MDRGGHRQGTEVQTENEVEEEAMKLETTIRDWCAKEGFEGAELEKRVNRVMAVYRARRKAVRDALRRGKLKR
jgi:hypothetical protein